MILSKELWNCSIRPHFERNLWPLIEGFFIICLKNLNLNPYHLIKKKRLDNLHTTKSPFYFQKFGNSIALDLKQLITFYLIPTFQDQYEGVYFINIFIRKPIVRLFSNWSWALWLLSKSYLLKKAHVKKCWWNWLNIWKSLTDRSVKSCLFQLFIQRFLWFIIGWSLHVQGKVPSTLQSGI